MTGGWAKVTSQAPCRICGKPDWCTAAADGAACCMRVESGRQLGNGGWLHRSTESVETGRPTRYEIRDAAGQLVALHGRRDLAPGRKILWWEQPGGRKGLGGRRIEDLPLYGTERLARLPDGETVLVCEGEKPTDGAHALGYAAVGTVTGAASSPSVAVLRSLATYDVVLWPDNDEPGRRHMATVAERLRELGVAPRLLEWRDAPPKGDAADYRPAGGTPESLRQLVATAAILDSRFTPIGNRENREKRETARFALTRLDDLLDEPEEETPWLLEGVLPAGGVSLCGAKPKVGKSTLARNLARAVAVGCVCIGRRTLGGAVVYLALEEKRGEVKKHFDRMGARGSPIFVHTGSAPEEALEALRAAIAEHQPVLAIVDPVLKLVRLRDANDYAEVSRAFEPLIGLARASGCHILCVHHLGKGERTGGDAVLGSTALFGAVDTLLLMKRRDAVRTIETLQRYGDDMPETVLALDPETGLVSIGQAVAEVQLQEVGAAVLAAMTGESLTEADIRERVGGNQALTARAIRDLVDAGKLGRSGEGKRGSPYLYRATTHLDSRFARLPIGANRENRVTEDRGGDAETAPEWVEERLRLMEEVAG